MKIHIKYIDEEHEKLANTSDRLCYVYYLGWLDASYIGSQYGKKCHPKHLMKTYFTSSKNVKNKILKDGLPNEIIILEVGFNKFDILSLEYAYIHDEKYWTDGNYCLNKKISCIGFENINTSGYATYKDIKTNKKYYLNKKEKLDMENKGFSLVGITSGIKQKESFREKQRQNYFKEVLKNGIHHLHTEDVHTKVKITQKKLIESGKHPFQSDAAKLRQRNKELEKLKNGTHISQRPEIKNKLGEWSHNNMRGNNNHMKKQEYKDAAWKTKILRAYIAFKEHLNIEPTEENWNFIRKKYTLSLSAHEASAVPTIKTVLKYFKSFNTLVEYIKGS